jgi:hypothetical protein
MPAPPSPPPPPADGEAEPVAPALAGLTTLLDVVPKPALIGLLAIVAVFAAGLCLGVRIGDGGQLNLDAPGVDLLEGLLTRRSSLALDDLEPNNTACLNRQQGRLIVAASCTYEVRTPARTTGRLTLRLDQGAEAALTLEQEDVLDSKARIRTNQQTRLDVFKERARLTVACTRGAGGVPCALRVLP